MTEREWLTTGDAARMWGLVQGRFGAPDDRRRVNVLRATGFMAAEYIAARDRGESAPAGYRSPGEWLDALCGPPQSPWEKARHANLAAAFRCVYGDPFRPAAFDPAWRTPDVLAVAAGLDAAFDPAGLPVLADALEEAGCGEAAVLSHLRGMRAAAPAGCGCRTEEMIVDAGRYSQHCVGVVDPCACPLRPGELHWEADPAPVRCRGDWALELVLGRC